MYSKNLWKTVFKKFEGVWSAEADHISLNFLKVFFHKCYLVHSWMLCPISVTLQGKLYRCNNEYDLRYMLWQNKKWLVNYVQFH